MPPGFRSPPRSAGQWIDHFTQSKTMWLPQIHDQQRVIDVKNIGIPEPGTKGDPDLLITTSNDKMFYVKFFRERRVYFPLNLPTFYFPVEVGTVGSFWIVREERDLKL